MFFDNENINEYNMTIYSGKTFDDIMHIDDEGNEFWYARELQIVLEYTEWRNFEGVIKKAKTACAKAGYVEKSHFVEINKMVEGGVAPVPIRDIMLSRYACYLIVQNGDPSKEIIALGQTYFAIQTRKQELSESLKFEQLSDDDRRLQLRSGVKDFNKKLANTASDAGVRNYGKFQNSGYQGLYNGETASDIKQRKRLKKTDDILDHMDPAELAANYFRITQTEEKLRKEKIKGEERANGVHYSVGRKVRNTMIEISGTAPENLPMPDKSIKQIEKERKKALKSTDKK